MWESLRVGKVMGTFAIGVVLLTGCSDDGGTAKSATCQAAQTAVDGAQRQAEIAIGQIADDPAASQSTLRAVRAALSTAGSAVSDDQRAQLERAGTATERLLAQARRSARGVPVDGEVVTKARADLLAAVSDVRAAC